MQAIHESHRGHDVVVRGTENEPEILIDGQLMDVHAIGKGTYASGALPFTNYSSLVDLAHDLIDHSQVFHGRRNV